MMDNPFLCTFARHFVRFGLVCCQAVGVLARLTTMASDELHPVQLCLRKGVLGVFFLEMVEQIDV